MKNLESILNQEITVDEMLNGKKETTKEEFIKIVHDMSYKDIAKQIRKDLKFAYGKDFKFSVTKEQYAGGGSINVNILEGNIEFYTPEYKEVQELDEYLEYEKFRESRKEEMTVEGKKILEDIKIIHNRYNHNNSDSMTDYFDVNYYGNVQIAKGDKQYINNTAS